MGKVVIYSETTKEPITLIGKMAGICYGSNTKDSEKNYKRGLECLKTNHGRTLEFPDIYMSLEDYSAKVIREFYTHIGGAPTRLQESTRYINYSNFDYVTPPKINSSKEAKEIYESCMKNIGESVEKLMALGIVKEDASGLLPLNYETTIVVKCNLRYLIDMSHQRMCTRAYWEYRQLFNDILTSLGDYSEEWKELVDIGYFKPKCFISGKCPEKNSCGLVEKFKNEQN
jgi:thymidylate synthase (FAD)